MTTRAKPDWTLLIPLASVLAFLTAPVWLNPAPIVVRIATGLLIVWSLSLAGLGVLLVRYHREQKAMWKPTSRDAHHESVMRMLGAKGGDR